MGLVETEGLVLKTYGLSDADKIVVFLTRDVGLVRGVAKGAKRLKSHFGSSLEPFSVVRLSYFQKDQQELVSVRECELLSSFFDKASDPTLLQKLAYMADLLGEFIPSGERNERAYNMTKVCLETRTPDSYSADALLLYFELWLLKLGGYLPDWENCASCGKKTLGNRAFLDPNFSLLCSDCGSGSAPSVSVEERTVFAAAQKMGPEKFIDGVAGKQESVKGVSKMLRRVIAGVLGRDWQEDRILSAIYE